MSETAHTGVIAKGPVEGLWCRTLLPKQDIKLIRCMDAIQAESNGFAHALGSLPCGCGQKDTIQSHRVLLALKGPQQGHNNGGLARARSTGDQSQRGRLGEGHGALLINVQADWIDQNLLGRCSRCEGMSQSSL